MPLSPKQLEDDIVREQNIIRQYPMELIRDLEDILHNRTQYYSKKNILLEAIGNRDMNEAVSTIFYLVMMRFH
jgi:hypothetical protein